MPYSNMVDVPDSCASQPATGMPARPATPVMTASARIAKRSKPSRVPVRSIVMADMVSFLSGWLPVPEPTPQPLTTAAPDPVMRESRETAHSEVLGIGEGKRDDGERCRRDHAEFGQRQPAADEHDGDEDREGDVSG